MISASKPRLWLRVLHLTTFLLVGAACQSRESPGEARVRVEAGPPLVQDVEVTLRYPIELEAAEKVAVSPVAVSGFLTSVLVDVGDKVRSGQVIAMVDCREYAAQRAQAETAISRWQAQEEESRSQLNRLVAMDQNKLVAPAELDRARAAHRVSEAQVADARAKLSEATQRQGYCWLKSPFDGYVSERNLDPGAMVGPGGQPVVTIVKTRDVKVVASVIEQDAPKVRRGAEVDVVLYALPDTPLRGTVARLGRSLDPKTRTLTVEVDIPNAQEVLMPGMTGRAAIVVGKRENALLLPVTALLNLEEASYVYVVREKEGKQRAQRIEVKLGVDLGDWLEVLEGLTAEDQVILVGRELVTEGTWVEVTPPAVRPALHRAGKLVPQPAVASVTSAKPKKGAEAKAPPAETPLNEKTPGEPASLNATEKGGATSPATDPAAEKADAAKDPNLASESSVAQGASQPRPGAPAQRAPATAAPAGTAGAVQQAPKSSSVDQSNTPTSSAQRSTPEKPTAPAPEPKAEGKKASAGSADADGPSP